MTTEETAVYENVARLASVRDRISRAMGWEGGGVSHKFQLIREICSGRAIALGIDKAEQIADRLESLPPTQAELDAAIGFDAVEGA